MGMMDYSTTVTPLAPPAARGPTANDVSNQQQYQAGEDVYAQGLDALQKQQAELGNTGGAWDAMLKAQNTLSDRSRQQIERQGGRALYQSRGSLGGGGGLAAVQNADAQNANNVANFNAQDQSARAGMMQQAQAAKVEALGAQAGAAGQRYKMMQEHTAGKQNRINQAVAAARQIIKEEGGSLYTTDKDHQRMRARMQQELLASETDPDVIAAVNDQINKVGSSNSGSLGDRIKSLF